MFCRCPTTFGASPNSQVCPVCLGLPGVLPVINGRSIELGLRTALALECTIPARSVFVRKSYFYPDLPKNFQTSQYQQPLAVNGHITVTGRKIRIRRVHLEEDTGKLLHDEGDGAWSRIDFNRSGIPLMEIVTDPDIHDPEEAEEFLLHLKRILSYIEVSDCSMEEGSLRCDANISLRRTCEQGLGTKSEVKNLNSFKSVRKALAYETGRQRDLLAGGKTVSQETRLWDEKNQVTTGMRSKEEAHDYRYFPEPDLLPVRVPEDMIEKTRAAMAELPATREARFRDQYGLSQYDSSVLTSTKALADYFEQAAAVFPHPKAVANWIQTSLLALLNTRREPLSACPVDPERFGRLVALVEAKTINNAAAKTLLEEMWVSENNPEQLVEEKNLSQISDFRLIETVAREVLAANPKAVQDVKNGREQAIGFLVGSVMKKTSGKANPAIAKEILLKLLRAV
jgi:aspartyl-tRNA(Asn)/glutamyl-tRNA(Gln) amidotransferase subunit B